jgi:hypothetical protein
MNFTRWLKKKEDKLSPAFYKGENKDAFEAAYEVLQRARQYNPALANKLEQMLLTAIHGDERDLLTWYQGQADLSSQLNNPEVQGKGRFSDRHRVRSDISNQLNNPESF